MTVSVDRPERIANWRAVGQPILVVPHYVFLHTVMAVAASVTAVIGWFAVLATGALPPRIAAFHATYVRYRARTFAYLAFLVDTYPRFDVSPSLSDPGGAGIAVDISATLENKNRLNVLFRFIVPFAWLTLIGLIALVAGSGVLPVWVWIVQLALGAVLIPAAVFSVVTWVVMNAAAVAALVAVLFTGRWPQSLFKVVAGWVRVDARLWAYSMLLTDDYPPFSIH